MLSQLIHDTQEIWNIRLSNSKLIEHYSKWSEKDLGNLRDLWSSCDLWLFQMVWRNQEFQIKLEFVN